MKILIPIFRFGREGGFRVLSKLANEFIRKGHEVHFIASASSDEPYHPTSAKLLWALSDGTISLKRKETVASRFNSFRALLNGLRNLKGEGYDIILANSSLSVYPVLLSGIKGECFYYIQAYEPDFFAEKPGVSNKLLSFLAKFSYLMPLAKIVNAPLYKNYKNITAADMVLPGLDLEIYQPKSGLVGKPVGRKWRIGTIARKQPIKGTRHIIEAYLKLRQVRNDIELYLAFGDESQTDPANDIFVVQPHGDVYLADFYKNIDIYVCAGEFQYGAVHYPVLEAMTSGTTLVTTPYYPANECNAWMMPYANSAEIIKRLSDVFEATDEEYILRKQNGVKESAKFSWEHVSDAMLGVFSRNTKGT